MAFTIPGHKDHLKILDQILEHLQLQNLKIDLNKCFFGKSLVPWLHADT